jgi:hypothetical protein
MNFAKTWAHIPIGHREFYGRFTVIRRSFDFMAYLDENPKWWGSGHNPQEAMGQVCKDHASKLMVPPAEAHVNPWDAVMVSLEKAMIPD